ncbi:hypothetical protein ACN47E_005720 [Coniothyrium glycines]
MSRLPRISVPTVQAGHDLFQFSCPESPTASASSDACPHPQSNIVDHIVQAPSPKSHATKVVKKTCRKPKITARTIARIELIDKVLDDIEQDVITRRLLIQLCEHKGAYCSQCTPLDKPGACGLTCSLLRPDSRKHRLGLSREWREDVIEHHKLYVSVVADMNEKGTKVYPITIDKWMYGVKKLHERGLNKSELAALWDTWTRRPMAYPIGTKLPWEFETAWCERRRLSSTVAPDEGLIASEQKGRNRRCQHSQFAL